MSNYQPPPSPPMWQQPVQYVAVEPGKGIGVAALVCGIIGAVFGLIPITSLVALALGLVAVVLGAIAWRKRGQVHLRRTMATWAVALGIVALTLGVIGMVIVQDTVNDLDREFNDIGQTNDTYVPPTVQEIDQATDDELWELWGDAPLGSDAETQIETELESRGLY